MKNITHLESVGDKWAPFLNNVEKEVPGVIARIVNDGGTREVWQVKEEKQETILMAYPQEGTFRACATFRGTPEGKLEPMTAIPLMEGIETELRVLDTYEWKSEVSGEVLAVHEASKRPFWFYNPLFFRDKKENLEVDKPQNFALAGLVYLIRKALLDEMTITQGENYDKYAMQYLADNPDKSRLDVPPMKVSLKGAEIVSLGQKACEYQARAVVRELKTFTFGPEKAETKMYSFVINAGLGEGFLPLVLYVSESVAQGLELKEGMEVDLYFWLQGRVAD